MLVLDCEGLSTQSRGFDMDVKVFTLTILLASSLVYNQIGHISDQALEVLSVIQMLTSQIKHKSQGAETGFQFSHFFPDLIWVLRDFEMEFKTLTPQSYLEQCLEFERDFSEDNQQQFTGSQQKNKVRELIK